MASGIASDLSLLCGSLNRDEDLGFFSASPSPPMVETRSAAASPGDGVPVYCPSDKPGASIGQFSLVIDPAFGNFGIFQQYQSPAPVGDSSTRFFFTSPPPTVNDVEMTEVQQCPSIILGTGKKRLLPARSRTQKRRFRLKPYDKSVLGLESTAEDLPENSGIIGNSLADLRNVISDVNENPNVHNSREFVELKENYKRLQDRMKSRDENWAEMRESRDLYKQLYDKSERARHLLMSDCKNIFLGTFDGYESEASKAMARLQIDSGDRREDYGVNEMALCIKIWTESKHFYRFLKSIGLVLPSEKRVEEWIDYVLEGRREPSSPLDSEYSFSDSDESEEVSRTSSRKLKILDVSQRRLSYSDSD